MRGTTAQRGSPEESKKKRGQLHCGISNHGSPLSVTLVTCRSPLPTILCLMLAVIGDRGKLIHLDAGWCNALIGFASSRSSRLHPAKTTRRYLSEMTSQDGLSAVRFLAWGASSSRAVVSDALESTAPDNRPGATPTTR